jgi:peptidoglycan DL-endopeptidase CwlO
VALVVRDRVLRRRRRVATCVVTALCAGLLAAAPAEATPGAPPPPSAAAVRRAHAAAAAAAAALARARTDATSAQARLDALDTQVEQAVEAWNGARADADAAAAGLALAQSEALAAQANADSAQSDLDRLAVASYQVGADLSGGLGEFAAVVDSAFRPGGITNLTDRMTQVGQVAAARRHGIDAALALRLRAAQAQAAAARSSADLAARESTVAAAADAVRALQTSQQGEVVRLVAQRDAAAAVLARTRTAASVLEATRAEALRRAAAARAAAAREAAAAEARRRALEHRGSGGRPPSDTGGSPRQWPDGASTSTAAQRLGALAFAKTQLGKPYVAGEHGPDSYDCSGLTSAAYATVGFPMVQYSKTQFARGQKIPVSALQPGDLVFFATDPNDWLTIHHVGIYAGGGQMVEAPHTGDHVKFQTIWQDELMAYGARP